MKGDDQMFMCLPQGSGRMIAIESAYISSMTYYCSENRVVIEYDNGEYVSITDVVDFKGLVDKVNEYRYGNKG